MSKEHIEEEKKSYHQQWARHTLRQRSILVPKNILNGYTILYQGLFLGCLSGGLFW